VKPAGARVRQLRQRAFSILERIDVGETQLHHAVLVGHRPFSILERIDVGETRGSPRGLPLGAGLSVSSNGSTWVKPAGTRSGERQRGPFSILERIDVGETTPGS